MDEEQYEKAMQRALELRNPGNLREAAKILKQLEPVGAQHPGVFGLLGATPWKLGRLAEAEHPARRAVELCPHSDLASRILFHILWDSGETAAAVEEVNRFLSVSESDDYEDILKEISDKGIELV